MDKKHGVVGRPKGTPKDVVYCRFDPATITALDAICEASSIKPSRAQLINAAVVEYIERHRKQERKSN